MGKHYSTAVKVVRVITSCITLDQLLVARNLLDIYNEHHQDININGVYHNKLKELTNHRTVWYV